MRKEEREEYHEESWCTRTTFVDESFVAFECLCICSIVCFVLFSVCFCFKTMSKNSL